METDAIDTDLKEAAILLAEMMSIDKSVEVIWSSELMKQIQDILQKQKDAIKHLHIACL